MIQRKPINRLGYNGINEIKEHPWLKYYPWKDLYEKKLESPFMPKNMDNFDKKYCEGPDKIGNDTLERYQNYYKNEALNQIFINYSYENLITVQTNKNESNKKSNINYNTNHNTYLNNLNNSKKKRINSSLTNLNINKNSLNNLIKSKMKISESIYLNNSNNQSQNILFSKNTPIKNRNNSMINSLNINLKPTLTPSHIRNMSSNSNLSVAFQNNINNNTNTRNLNHNNNNNNNNLNSPNSPNIINHIANNNTPNKNRTNNNTNLMKSRNKNLSINSSANISNINLAPGNSSAVNNINSNINININNSSSVISNMKQTSNTPFVNKHKNMSEKLPFILEQKFSIPRQSSTNISFPKKIVKSPNKNLIGNSNVSYGIGASNQHKSGNKYTTLSSNSTGSTTLSMNFLHRRSGSTATFNNHQ